VIETKNGKIKGLLLTLTDKSLGQVEVYYGIQYASLSGSQLRFLPPTVSNVRWDNIKPHVSIQPVCPQNLPDIKTSDETVSRERAEHLMRILPHLKNQAEDCLYLNVYVPVGG
ncbi:hypothetical protein HELRODRAFT_127427, partial [Helobdella robusta]|uniref:Carboxylesterase type B domain-containing protein n=1 Tax=Helobdella robusta TaxID=6412 RepID=T1EHE6_HELRO